MLYSWEGDVVVLKIYLRFYHKKTLFYWKTMASFTARSAWARDNLTEKKMIEQRTKTLSFAHAHTHWNFVCMPCARWDISQFLTCFCEIVVWQGRHFKFSLGGQGFRNSFLPPPNFFSSDLAQLFSFFDLYIYFFYLPGKIEKKGKLADTVI